MDPSNLSLFIKNDLLLRIENVRRSAGLVTGVRAPESRLALTGPRDLRGSAQSDRRISR
jgi:hypothetical protein